MHLNLDTKTPINQLPAGSVRYEFIGGTMMMNSTAGQRVSPSGYGRGLIKKSSINRLKSKSIGSYF